MPVSWCVAAYPSPGYRDPDLLGGTNTRVSLQAKMVYASSKEALKRALPGLAVEVQANDADDIEYESLVKTVSKGTAAI